MPTLLTALTVTPSALVDGSMGVCEFSSTTCFNTHNMGRLCETYGVQPYEKKNENEIELEQYCICRLGKCPFLV